MQEKFKQENFNQKYDPPVASPAPSQSQSNTQKTKRDEPQRSMLRDMRNAETRLKLSIRKCRLLDLRVDRKLEPLVRIKVSNWT